MTILFGVFYFILGTFVGSFLNVAALRHNTGQSVIVGRSHCFSCGKVLMWFELIPILSYFAILGKCRSCKSTISLQYPLVELLTGVLFLGVFLKFVPLLEQSLFYFLFFTLYFLTIISLLIIILIYDIRHTIVPNLFVYIFIGLSFFLLFINPEVAGGVNGAHFFISIPTMLDFFAGPTVFLPFFLLWFIGRGAWMGLGDGKLALGIGWLLGLAGGFSAVILGFWLGAFMGLLLLLMPYCMRTLQHTGFLGSRLFSWRKRFTMKSEIPFAPFLIIGFLLVFFFDVNVLEIII